MSLPPAERAQILALADGRIPPGVDPDSREGRDCAAIISAVAADMAVAPPMTQAQKDLVVTLLRGGDRHAATG